MSIFKKILEKRANALLFSEETISFYQYNIQVMPQEMNKYAVAYLMRLLTILLNYNTKYYNELFRAISKKASKELMITKDDLQQFALRETCREISDEMELQCHQETEDQHLQREAQKKRRLEKEEKARIAANLKEQKKKQQEENPQDDGIAEVEINKSIKSEDSDNKAYGQEQDHSEEDEAPAADDDEEEEKSNEDDEDKGPKISQEDKKFLDDGKHNWKVKCARYLAFAVDGGILCSQFTLVSLLEMLKEVNDDDVRKEVKQEISYLLNIRLKGLSYDRNVADLNSQIEMLKAKFQNYTMNYRVLVVLIESGYI